MVEAAVHRHVNDLGVGFLEELFCLMQAERDALGNERLAEMAAKQPAEMADAAPALPRELVRRLVLPLALDHLRHQRFKPLFGGQRRTSCGRCWI